MEHWLVFREPSGQEKMHKLQNASTTVGRNPDNDIVFLNEHSISRKHVRIAREGNDYYAEDLGSKNGTKVNGQTVKRHKLAHNDQILLGKVTLVYKADQQSDSVQKARIVEDDKELDSVGTIIRSLDDLMLDEDIAKFVGTQAMRQQDAWRKPAVPAAAAAHQAKDPSSDIEKNNLKLKIMYQVARKLNEAPTLEKFLSEVLEMAFEVVSAERGFIKLIEEGDKGNGLEVVRFQNTVSDQNITLSKTISNTAMKQKVAILVHDAQMDSRFCQEDSIQLYGIRSAACVPIWNRTNIYGILYADCLLSTRSFSQEDLELLTALANQAAIGIERQRLDEAFKEEQRRRGHMARYFSPDVVDVIINKKQERKIEEREVTVMFADLSGFTPLSERLKPTELVEILNKYLELCVDTIFQNHGTLDKFMGDCVMGLFGVPLPLHDAPERAISAALEIVDGLARQNQDRPEELHLAVRIGINTGRSIVGDIGPITRLEYTVLGDTVNTAQRLQSQIAKRGQVVVGEATYQQAADKFIFREIGHVQVKGKQKQARAYEVLGRLPASAPTMPAAVSTKQLLQQSSVG